MSATKKKAPAGTLGLRTDDIVTLVKAVQSGFSFATMVRFQNNSGLPVSVIANVLGMPLRALARRRTSGKLSGPESERLLRLAGVFEKAQALFEGDRARAVEWLQVPNQALGNRAPLDLVETEVGARAVEDLIGRLEYGVFS